MLDLLSLGAVTKNPAMFSNPITAGIAAAPYVAMGVNKLINPAHEKASRFVNEFENPFGAKLAEIQNLSATDPAAAKSAFEQAWSQFNSGIQQFTAQGGQHAKAARQALSNQGLMSTVQRLAQQLGVDIGGGGNNAGPVMPTTGTAINNNTQDLGGNRTPSLGDIATTSLSNINSFSLPKLGNYGTITTPGPKKEGGIGPIIQEGIRTAGTIFGAPRTTVNVNNPTGGTTNPNETPEEKAKREREAKFGVDDFLKQWLPTIILGVTGILGAKSSSDAAERIAEIQGKGVQSGIDLTREMFNKGVELQMPAHRRGTAALYKLSDFMGLPRDESMADVPISTMRTNPGGRPALAPTMGSSASGVDEWDQAAARFKR